MKNDDTVLEKEPELKEPQNVTVQPATDRHCEETAPAGTAPDEHRAEEADPESHAQENRVEQAHGRDAHEERSGSDLLVEGLSAEANIGRMERIIPKKVAVYIVAALYLAVGVLCVSITHTIAEVLPYIIGSAMALIGLVRFIFALVTQEFKSTKTNKTATSFILMGFAALILYEQISGKHDDAIILISIAWGLEGLFEGAHAFNHAFATMCKSWKCVYFFLRGIIECAVAFFLLYDPISHDAHFIHIVVFGANLILDSITMIPPVRNLIEGKRAKKQK